MGGLTVERALRRQQASDLAVPLISRDYGSLFPMVLVEARQHPEYSEPERPLDVPDHHDVRGRFEPCRFKHADDYAGCLNTTPRRASHLLNSSGDPNMATATKRVHRPVKR